MADDNQKNNNKNLDFEKYKSYLLENESMEGVYNLGFTEQFKLYKLILTDKRVLIIKKFPQNFIEIEYNDIEMAEYYTNVEWIKLVYSFIAFFITVIFFMVNDHVIASLIEVFPPIKPLIEAGNIFGLNAVAFLILFCLVAVGLYYLGFFIRSLYGVLRILIYEQAPIDILTHFDAELQMIINKMQSRKRQAQAANPPRRE